MTTSVTHAADKFDTTIRVAGVEVAPDEYSEGVVLAFEDGGERVIRSEVACALGAALQAVAVHQLESQPREIRRSTEAGAPTVEDLDGVGL